MNRSNKFLIQSLCITLMLIQGSLCVYADDTKVDKAISQFEKNLSQKQAAFSTVEDWENIAWVKKKLSHMFDVDQYMRKESAAARAMGFSEQEQALYAEKFRKFYKQIDTQNTQDLKKIIAIHNWPTISKFGRKSERQAWLLAQHADTDLSFQKEVLSMLEDLLPQGETDPSNYAYLFDRVAASYNDPSKRSLQMYGTQGRCVGKEWQPFPMVEPEKLDERRASVGLNTMAEYLEMVNKFCQ